MNLRTFTLGTAALAGLTGGIVLANPLTSATSWVEPATTGGAVLVGTFDRETASTEPSPPTRDEPLTAVLTHGPTQTPQPGFATVVPIDPIGRDEVVDRTNEAAPAAPTSPGAQLPPRMRDAPTPAKAETKDSGPASAADDTSRSPAEKPSSIGN